MFDMRLLNNARHCTVSHYGGWADVAGRFEKGTGPFGLRGTGKTIDGRGGWWRCSNSGVHLREPHRFETPNSRYQQPQGFSTLDGRECLRFDGENGGKNYPRSMGGVFCAICIRRTLLRQTRPMGDGEPKKLPIGRPTHKCLANHLLCRRYLTRIDRSSGQNSVVEPEMTHWDPKSIQDACADAGLSFVHKRLVFWTFHDMQREAREGRKALIDWATEEIVAHVARVSLYSFAMRYGDVAADVAGEFYDRAINWRRFLRSDGAGWRISEVVRECKRWGAPGNGMKRNLLALTRNQLSNKKNGFQCKNSRWGLATWEESLGGKEGPAFFGRDNYQSLPVLENEWAEKRKSPVKGEVLAEWLKAVLAMLMSYRTLNELADWAWAKMAHPCPEFVYIEGEVRSEAVGHELRGEMAKLAYRIVGCLDTNERRLLRWRLEGMPLAEIGDKLNQTKSTISGRITKLLQKMEARGGDDRPFDWTMFHEEMLLALQPSGEQGA